MESKVTWTAYSSSLSKQNTWRQRRRQQNSWEPYEVTSHPNYNIYGAPPNQKTYRKLWPSCLTWRPWERTKGTIVQISKPGRTGPMKIGSLMTPMGITATSDVSAGASRWLQKWTRDIDYVPKRDKSLRRPLNPNALDFHRRSNVEGVEPRPMQGD